MNDMLLVENVAAGVALLDRVMPDWRDHIDLEMLEMSSGKRCIVGQLFSLDNDWTPYTRGIEALGLDFDGARMCGFDFIDSADEYSRLDGLWRAAINTTV